MAPQCSICTSEARAAIEEEMEAGTSNRAVAKMFNSNEKTIRRHRQHAGFDIGAEDKNGGKTMSLLQMAKIPNGEKSAAMIEEEIAALQAEIAKQQQLEHRVRFGGLTPKERHDLEARYGVNRQLVSNPDEQLRGCIFNHYQRLAERVERLESLSATVEKTVEDRRREVEEMARRAREEVENVEARLGHLLLELWTTPRNPKNNRDADREYDLKFETGDLERLLKQKQEQLHRIELAGKALEREVTLDPV